MNPALVIIPATLLATLLLAWRWFNRDWRPVFPKKTGQDEAVNAIWYEHFGVKKSWWNPRRPPAIRWVEGNELNYGGVGWMSGYDYTGDGKPDPVAGLAHAALGHPWSGSVEVAWLASQTKFSDKPYLVHEMYHCKRAWVDGDQDSQHRDPGFYAPDGTVARGVALLRARGL